MFLDKKFCLYILLWYIVFFRLDNFKNLIVGYEKNGIYGLGYSFIKNLCIFF